MRVYCINDTGWEIDNTWLWGLIKRGRREVSGPKYGDECTVVDGYWEDGKYYYELLEWPPNNGENGFQADCFIPLSDIDETELVNQKEEAV